MLKVRTEIHISKPIEMVADYAANPDNAPEWYVNIRSAAWKTPKPLAVGSQIAFIAHFLGRELVYTYEVMDFIPRQKLVMRTVEGPFPMQTTYIWTSIDNGTTRMILENQGEPKGFSKIFAPFMAGMMKRANQKDLKNLRRILERRSRQT